MCFMGIELKEEGINTSGLIEEGKILLFHGLNISFEGFNEFSFVIFNGVSLLECRVDG